MVWVEQAERAPPDEPLKTTGQRSDAGRAKGPLHGTPPRFESSYSPYVAIN